MKLAAGTCAGIVVGVGLTCYLERAHWAQRLLWWLFTSDVRHTHPHIYGRKAQR